MAPSIDKQSTKMVNILPSDHQEKPMDICVVSAATTADHTTSCYVNEFCIKDHQESFDFHTTMDLDDSHDDEDLYEQKSIARRCSFAAQQLVSSNHRYHHQKDIWSMRVIAEQQRRRVGIAINGGVDAIRQATTTTTTTTTTTMPSPVVVAAATAAVAALQLLVRHRDYEMMERLLCSGAADNVDAYDATGNTALHLAAQLRDTRAAEILLTYNADPNVKTARGFDCMTLAVQAGCTQLVEMLIKIGCNINQMVEDYDMRRNFSLLHCAVECNHFEMVRLLLHYEADVNQRDSYGNTCLHNASRLGRTAIVQLLLEHGAQIHDKSFNKLTALYFAVENGHRDIFELLLNYGANMNDRGLSDATLLHYAIKNGDVGIINTLLHRGAPIDATNKFGKTPLHCAIAEKNWQALKMLIEHGAHVNSKDANGKTTLHKAIESCRKEIYEILLRYGADVNAKDNVQQTPLHSAVKQGCYATVELLLRHNADVNARDDNRQTPLHLAVKFGHVRLFEVMLRYSVDVNAADINGHTPLHLAVVNEHSKLIYCGYPYTFFAHLLNNGAKVRSRTVATGETPLHVAVKKKCSIFTKHLLSRGSDVDAIESVEQKTSMQVAVENKDIECIEHLLTYGADITSVNFNQEISQEVLQVFTRYFIRKISAGVNVDPKYLRLVINDEEFTRQCEDEVKKLKLTKICNEQTYYDFLRGNRRCLVNFVRNNEVCTVFENHTRTNFISDESALKRNFPIFADMLERNYYIGVRYAPLLNTAAETLNNLCKLPDVPTERILDFLNDVDMCSLVN